jgi:hypothetical protein
LQANGSIGTTKAGHHTHSRQPKKFWVDRDYAFSFIDNLGWENRFLITSLLEAGSTGIVNFNSFLTD